MKKTNLLRTMVLALGLLASMGAWAETSIRTTATFLFNQFYGSATVATFTTTSETKGFVYDYDNLYLCVGDGSAGRTRTITAQAAATMPNATAPSVSDVTPFAKGDYVGLKYNASSRTPSNTGADNIANYNLASFRAASPGKLYVLATTKTSGKDITIHQNSGGTVTKVANVSRSTDDWILVSCDVANGCRYYIGCQDEDSWILYGVKFVPSTDATAHTNHDKSVSVSGGYATFSSACNYSVPANYKAYVVSSIGDDKATLTQITHIPSNTGVILVGDDKDTEVITMKNIRESDITAADRTVAASNSLIANVGAYALPASNGSYYNYTLAAGPVFKHSTGSGTLAAGKAFLRTTVNVEGGSAPSLSLVFDDNNTTGIDETIRMNNNSGMSDKTFYNLSGQRVTNPTKGLYIVNGKKVVIK